MTLPESQSFVGAPATTWGMADQWFPVCASDELTGRTPLARTLQGVRLVLFRGAGGAPTALLDRCPHRNVPLSEGRVESGTLECMYHGWRFDGGGTCVKVPGLCRELTSERGSPRDATRYPCREQQGLIWVYATPGADPDSEPYRLPQADEPGYTTVCQSVDFPGGLLATVENALDVPHTAFLHRGLFRGGGKTNRIEVEVRRGATWAEAEYIGEPRPEGLVGWILSPSGGVVSHWDRFILPCVAQVEYRLGDENHFLVTSLMTPVSEGLTRAFAVVSFRLRLPGWLVKPFVFPIAMRIFRQDARVLALQYEAEEHWGGRQYVSTEIDVLGAQIQRLLRRAAQGRLEDDERPWSKRLQLEA